MDKLELKNIKKLGLLGGTFDPPHIAHLRIAEEVRENFGLEKIAFIPTAYPPHKKLEEYSPFQHRLEMVKLAIKSNPFFLCLDIEKDIKPSYTLKTLQILKKNLPNTEFFFIIGPDSFVSINTWWKWEELPKWAHFIVLTNRTQIFSLDYFKNLAKKLYKNLAEKFLFFENTPLNISSSKIRKLVKEKKSIKYLVLEEVEDYIKKHKLYK